MNLEGWFWPPPQAKDDGVLRKKHEPSLLYRRVAQLACTHPELTRASLDLSQRLGSGSISDISQLDIDTKGR